MNSKINESTSCKYAEEEKKYLNNHMEKFIETTNNFKTLFSNL